MIRNFIVLLSIAGALILLFSVMENGLGRRWDELGVIIFLMITTLMVIDRND